MNSLYLILNLGSIALPLLFSFHPKIKFHKVWRSFFAGTLVMMVIFITWDVIFTKNGIWGFNENYLTGLYALGLPIEEWMFFLCIPYACIFTHHTLNRSFPKMVLSSKTTNIVYFSLLIFLLISSLIHFDKWYTVINFLYLTVLLIVIRIFNSKVLPVFFITFLILLIPFFLVNGILTGSMIESPIVWYDNQENLGIRIGTIPLEDVFYAFGMLLTILFTMELLQKNKETDH